MGAQSFTWDETEQAYLTQHRDIEPIRFDQYLDHGDWITKSENTFFELKTRPAFRECDMKRAEAEREIESHNS